MRTRRAGWILVLAVIVLLSPVATYAGATYARPMHTADPRTTGPDPQVLPRASAATVSPQLVGPEAQVRFAVSSTIVLRDGEVLPGNAQNVTNVAQPLGIAYENISNEYLISGGTSDQAGFFSATDGTLDGGVRTGQQPSAVVFDPSTNLSFVAIAASDLVTVISNANGSVLGSIAVGTSPNAMVLDNLTDQLFVANLNSGNVSVISISDLSVVASIPVEFGPGALQFAWGSREVFVGYGFEQNITVISDLTDSVVATLHMGSETDGFAYDAATDRVFAALGSQGLISVIDAASNSIALNFSSGFDLVTYMVFDDGRGELYASALYGGRIDVFSGTTHALVTRVPLAPYPGALAYDPTSGTVAALSQNDLLTVISDATHRILWNASTGASPGTVLYGARSNQLFVAGSFAPNLTVLNPATGLTVGHFPAGVGLVAAAEDPLRNAIFVANEQSDNVTVLNETTGATMGNVPTGFGMVAIAYAAATSNIYLSVYQSGIPVLSDTTYAGLRTLEDPNVPFTLVDVPGAREMFALQQPFGYNTEGQVQILSEDANATVGTVTVGQDPAGGAYDAAQGEVFVSNYFDDNISIVSVAQPAVVGVISYLDGPSAMTYDPQTSEIFVATGSDQVTAISALTDRVLFSLPVGTGPDTLAYDPVTGAIFVGNYASGTLTVLSPIPGSYLNNVTVGVSPASCGPLVFNGTSVGGSTVVQLPSGTVSASVTACPDRPFLGWQATGGVEPITPAALTTNVIVTDDGSLTALFGGLPPPDFPVFFNATGLPAAAPWTVALGGNSIGRMGSSIEFNVTNGSYPFTVRAPGGYVATPAQGSVSVQGAPFTEPIVFTPTHHTVTFEESGLPAGTGWSLTVNGSQVGSTKAALSVSLRDGSYAWALIPVPGYNGTPASGTVVVAGQNVNVSITWSLVAGFPGGGSTIIVSAPGIPLIVALAIVGLVVAAAAGAIAWVVLRRQRPPPETAPE